MKLCDFIRKFSDFASMTNGTLAKKAET